MPVLEELNKHRADVEALIRAVPGVEAYFLIKGTDGGASVTVCRDQAAAQETTRQARAWVQENVKSAMTSTPEITEGEVIIRI